MANYSIAQIQVLLTILKGAVGDCTALLNTGAELNVQHDEMGLPAAFAVVSQAELAGVVALRERLQGNIRTIMGKLAALD